jgi:hypothetical protein
MTFQEALALGIVFLVLGLYLLSKRRARKRRSVSGLAAGGCDGCSGGPSGVPGRKTAQPVRWFSRPK